MDLVKGDIIIGVEHHNLDIKKEILKKRKTGCNWKYLGGLWVYRSENSSDPCFEWDWKKV